MHVIYIFWENYYLTIFPILGVLEADCIEPTHNKQDFERTQAFNKLENRMKQLTIEYW